MTLVRYESSEVFVNVYHGRASYELGVEIGRLKEPEAKLSILDVVRWAGAEQAEGFGKYVTFQVSSRHGVEEFVPKLAVLVKKHAIPLLRGDEKAYHSALELRAKQYADEVKQGNLSVVRGKAEEAWLAKDYAQVVELYGPVREELTEVEAKKLAYAEQQVLAAEGVGSRSSSRKEALADPVRRLTRKQRRDVGAGNQQHDTDLLALVGLGACYIPARRAVRVDPMIALRHE